METMRSGVPSFEYHGPLCAMSAKRRQTRAKRLADAIEKMSRQNVAETRNGRTPRPGGAPRR